VTVLPACRRRPGRDLDAETVRALVERRVHQAIAAGCDGWSQPAEAAWPAHSAVTTGGHPRRAPDWSAKNDQARAATPLERCRQPPIVSAPHHRRQRPPGRRRRWRGDGAGGYPKSPPPGLALPVAEARGSRPRGRPAVGGSSAGAARQRGLAFQRAQRS
jgi:hypothetical protein